MMTPTGRAVVAAVIGNALEWYDFILYALFSPFIAHAFFPAKTEVASLLLAVGTFGAGFVVRPLGALVLGQYADRAGRRPALTLIIAMMTVATGLIVFTPDASRIGLAAPLLIVASRLLQGFSVGGELGSSTALLIESAPPGRRGLYASWQGTSQHIAALAGVTAGAATAAWLSPAVLGAWGWRLPFAAGLLIGPVGLYIRANVHEPAGVVRALRAHATPLRTLWTDHRGALFRTVGLISLGTMSTYVLGLNMPAYAHRQLGVPVEHAFLANMASYSLSVGLFPWAGALSDRIGARRVMLPAAAALGLAVLPGFLLLTAVPTLWTLIAVQTACLCLLAVFSAPLYGMVGGLFPPEVRSSGLAVGYNISVLMFGGFAPLVTTWLIAATGNRHMPGLYVTAGAVVTITALLVRWPDKGPGARPLRLVDT